MRRTGKVFDSFVTIGNYTIIKRANRDFGSIKIVSRFHLALLYRGMKTILKTHWKVLMLQRLKLLM